MASDMNPTNEKPRCFKCGAELNFPDRAPGRRDSCDKCGADVHVCRNCRHYDAKAYNECHEPQADRVVEKDRANFCDYFSLGGGKQSDGEAKADIMKRLDDLFKR